MANRSKSPRPAALRAAASALRSRPLSFAQGRLHHGAPIAVIDIGSNSVRLVIYEGLTRAPTPIFNEKVLAGLGREVQSTGLLAADAVEKALEALRRFRALCDIGGVQAGVVCRDRGLPRCAERARVHRGRRAHLPQADRGADRQAGGAVIRRSALSPAFTSPTGSWAISAAARSN